MQNSTRVRLTIAAVSVASVLSGCGGEQVSSPQQEVVGSVTFAEGNASILIREQRTLAPVFRRGDGVLMLTPADAIWTSSDSTVAAVDASGTVHGVRKGGPVAITVEAGSASATQYVNVGTRLALSTYQSTVGIGHTARAAIVETDFLGAVVGTSDARWASSAPAVVGIDPASGVYTGLSSGVTTVSGTVGATALSFDVEAGVLSDYEGTWTRSTPGLSLTFVVLFGRVVRLAMPTSVACGPQVVVTTPVPILDGMVTVDLPAYSATWGGTFTSPTSFSGSYTAVNVPLGTYTCPGTIVTQTGPFPAATFTATKQ